MDEVDNEMIELAGAMAEEVDPSQQPSQSEPEKSPEELANEILDEEEPTEEPSDDDEGSDAQDEASEEDEDASEDDDDEDEDEDDEELEEESEENSDSDDESSDADSEVLHKVTVDGEEAEVSLKDLKENFAGKQAWDKKFQELDVERQEHKTQTEQFNNNAKQFQELAKEGKAQEALDFIIDLAGFDKNQFVEAYVSQLAPTIAEYLELSPEEREQRALKQQNEYLRNQHETAQKSQADALARDAQRSQVEAVMKEHAIGAERFEELQKELIEAGVDNLTPEAVGQYHTMVVHHEVAAEVLKEINPDLVADKSAMDYMLSLQKNNPGMKKGKLKARAEKAFSDALAERVKKDSKAAKPRKKGASKAASKKAVEDILTFDDLEDINILDLLGE